MANIPEIQDSMSKLLKKLMKEGKVNSLGNEELIKNVVLEMTNKFNQLGLKPEDFESGKKSELLSAAFNVLIAKVSNQMLNPNENSEENRKLDSTIDFLLQTPSRELRMSPELSKNFSAKLKELLKELEEKGLLKLNKGLTIDDVIENILEKDPEQRAEIVSDLTKMDPVSQTNIALFDMDPTGKNPNALIVNPQVMDSVGITLQNILPNEKNAITEAMPNLNPDDAQMNSPDDVVDTPAEAEQQAKNRNSKMYNPFQTTNKPPGQD